MDYFAVMTPREQLVETVLYIGQWTQEWTQKRFSKDLWNSLWTIIHSSWTTSGPFDHVEKHWCKSSSTESAT